MILKNLITNEFIKIIKRPFIWIMISIILFSQIIFASIFSSQSNTEDDIDLNWEENYRTNIEDLTWTLNNVEKLDEYGTDFALTRDHLNFSLEHNIKPSDWRNGPAFGYLEALKQGDKEKADYFYNIFINDDWKEYLQIDIDYNNEILKRDEQILAPYAYESDYLSTVEKNELYIKYNIRPDTKNKMKAVLDQYISNKTDLLGVKYFPNRPDFFLTDNQIKNLEKQNKILIYRLENNLADTEVISPENYLLNVSKYISYLIILFMIILSSINISNEYTFHTIKNILIYPCKRYKIILSKYIVLSSLGFFLVLITLFFSYIISLIYFGETTTKYIFIIKEDVISMNYINYIFVRFLLEYVRIFAYLTVSLSVSQFFKNSNLVIGLLSMIVFVHEPLTKYLTEVYRFSWLKYIPFSSFNFIQFLDNTTVLRGFNLPLSLFIFTITTLFFNFILFKSFKNQEI